MLRARNLLSISSMAILATLVSPTHSVAQSPAAKMKDCLLIEDGYKERLDCYDAVIKPEPKAGAKKAKIVAECRFVKEEDERLACFNGFVVPKPKSQALGKSTKAPKNGTAAKTAPPPKQ